jgi:hypothetical protein
MSEKMKVLIAYDGSSCADAAIDDLWRAGLGQATLLPEEWREFWGATPTISPVAYTAALEARRLAAKPAGSV